MSRMTIDFGIDLGTTNSAIAVVGEGIQVIKCGLSEVLPSAVYIDKKGTTHVGEFARQRWPLFASVNDAQMEFKREMGTVQKFSFKSAGLVMSAEELSAEVLKELRKYAGERFNEPPPRAIVITIPAMFEAEQREATVKAGELAGFQQVELLQEPVAAAVAFGFQSDAQSDFWLVFDFGGGTFDAAIIAIRDGELAVVRHAGDNFLGGASLDWAVVETVLLPKIESLGDFSHLCRADMKSNDDVKTAMRKLKMIFHH